MSVHTIQIILTFVLVLVLHEIGHFLAARACRIPVTEAGLGWGPKLCSIRVYGVDYFLRLLPLGAYVRMDIGALQKRPFLQQLFTLFSGNAVNLILGAIAWGTMFGTLNVALAIGSLLPLYQHDGWKIGMVICRRAFGRPSPLVEWSLTISGVLIGLAVLVRVL